MPSTCYLSGDDLFRIILAVILLTSSSQSLIWNEGLTGEIAWGESLSLGEHSIRLADLSLRDSSDTSVLLQAFRGRSCISTFTLAAGESHTVEEALNVTLEEISNESLEDGEPYSRIRMQLLAEPEISLVIVPDKDAYMGGEEINLRLEVRNEGLVEAEGLDISLDFEPPICSLSCRKSLLDAGEVLGQLNGTNKSDNISFKLKAPYYACPTDVKVRAHARYAGQEGEALHSIGGAVFRISGPLRLRKIAEELKGSERRYMITDTLENCWNRTLDVRLTDRAGPDFTSESPQSRELRLSPGETAALSYLAEPVRPGSFSLPAAEASYEFEGREYVVRSEIPAVEVDGPFIEVRRTASQERVLSGGMVRVSLVLCNKGNRRAMVSLKEQVPAGARLATPGIGCSFIMPSNQSRSFEYDLLFLASGEIEIPETEVSYRDAQGYVYTARSPALRVHVDQPQARDASPSEGGHEEAVERREAMDTEEDGGNLPELYSTYGLLAIILALVIAIRRYP